MRCSGLCSLVRMAKYRPDGPPPTHTISTLSALLALITPPGGARRGGGGDQSDACWCVSLAYAWGAHGSWGAMPGYPITAMLRAIIRVGRALPRRSDLV